MAVQGEVCKIVVYTCGCGRLSAGNGTLRPPTRPFFDTVPKPRRDRGVTVTLNLTCRVIGFSSVCCLFNQNLRSAGGPRRRGLVWSPCDPAVRRQGRHSWKGQVISTTTIGAVNGLNPFGLIFINELTPQSRGD